MGRLIVLQYRDELLSRAAATAGVGRIEGVFTHGSIGIWTRHLPSDSKISISSDLLRMLNALPIETICEFNTLGRSDF